MTLQISSYSNERLGWEATRTQVQGHTVWHEQKFNAQGLATFMKRFGNCETPDLFMNPKKTPEIFLVTGKKDKHGKKLGMFGDTELGWHSNGNSRHNVDKILIALYCVEEDDNTCLSICNTTRPFMNMSPKLQEYYSDITIKLKFKNDTIYHLDEGDPELEFMSASKGSIRKLVGMHPHTHQPYFYFPYHFIEQAWKGKEKIDTSALVKDLKKIIFKSQYMTHHIFKKGDLVLMDQFTSLHRRTPVYDTNRLLWRVASDYNTLCL